MTDPPEIAKAADPLDPLLIARLEGWVGEMRRSAKAMQDAGLNDVAAGNLNVARDIEGGLGRLYALLSERSTSMERIRVLEARLEPFMREADRLDPLPRDPVALINDNVEVWQCGNESFRRSRITYGDLRAARAALQQEIMGEVLKPCPFCGGAARAFKQATGYFIAHCIDCQAAFDECDTYAEAIAAWNRRSLPVVGEGEGE